MTQKKGKKKNKVKIAVAGALRNVENNEVINKLYF